MATTKTPMQVAALQKMDAALDTKLGENDLPTKKKKTPASTFGPAKKGNLPAFLQKK